jgi:hypothetical protein
MILNLPKVPIYHHVPDTGAGRRTGQHNLPLNLREVPFGAIPRPPEGSEIPDLTDTVAVEGTSLHNLLLNLREVFLREVPC